MDAQVDRERAADGPMSHLEICAECCIVWRKHRHCAGSGEQRIQVQARLVQRREEDAKVAQRRERGRYGQRGEDLECRVMEFDTIKGLCWG